MQPVSSNQCSNPNAANAFEPVGLGLDYAQSANKAGMMFAVGGSANDYQVQCFSEGSRDKLDNAVSQWLSGLKDRDIVDSAYAYGKGVLIVTPTKRSSCGSGVPAATGRPSRRGRRSHGGGRTYDQGRQRQLAADRAAQAGHWRQL
jgi:hypothetical protein